MLARVSRCCCHSFRTVYIATTYSTSAPKDPLVILDRDKDDSRVAIIRLNQPDRLNALSVAVCEAFAATVRTIQTSSDIRAVVLTGAGKAFSAGGELSWLRQRTNPDVALGDSNVRTMLDFYARLMSVRKIPVPVIAAINGPAVGAGLCLAMACDIRIAATDARMGVNFTQLGLHPGMGCTHFMPLLIGAQQASYLMLTSEPITGQDAQQMGLVLRAVAKDKVLSDALGIAKAIAKGSPQAVRQTVLTLRAKFDSGLEAALLREADAQTHCYNHREFKEGLDAVEQKRPPLF